MRYTQTSAGAVIEIDAEELCRGSDEIPVSTKKAAEFSFLPGLVQNKEKRALVEHDGIKYLVSCKAAGYCPGSGQSPDKIVCFFRAKSGSSHCPQPSIFSLCCAALFALANDKPVVIRRVLLDRSLEGSISVSDTEYTPAVLCERLHFLLTLIQGRAEYEIIRHRELLPLLARLKFPHSSLREGQKELIERVYTAVRQKERLFAQAPTGIGKTVSVLYGAVRAMAGADFRRIFYLTAKISTRREAFSAVAKLNEAGAGLRCIVLASKEDMCPRAMGRKGCFACEGDSCPYMKNYDSRIPEPLHDLLERHRGYPVKTVFECAASHAVCPYEFSLDLAEYCDIVICDYNSVFDPAVRLKRFFSGRAAEDAVLLTDEAHNLPVRARDTFSAVLSEGDLDSFFSFINEGMQIYPLLERLREKLLSLGELCRENTVKDENGLESGWFFDSSVPADLTEAVLVLLPVLIQFRAIHRDESELFAASGTLLRKLSKWLDAADAFDSKYRTYIELQRGVISAKLFCLDPSERLDETLSRVHASVFFSATLTPSDYFADILGGTKNSSSLSLPSPFPRDNLFIAAVTCIDTRYESRDKSAKRISTAIASVASAKKGNYMVFFPSYSYMTEVAKIFTEKYPNVRVRIQKSGMSRAEHESFLSFFEDDKGILRIGFCVLGGSFSEGIDLPGGRLIGTVIVGVGLPGLSAENNIIRDYYETRSECGFDYAYTYPGMNNVLQAAGRVIRREQDTGVVILIDDRYAEERYKALMPAHWSGISYVSDLHDLTPKLAEFWAKRR